MVIDTSAILAILFNESDAEYFETAAVDIFVTRLALVKDEEPKMIH